MKFNEKILYCRKKADLSQEALAEKLGVSRQAVSKWENGESTPDLEKLVLLSQIFSVTTDWMLSPEEPREEPIRPSQPKPDWVDSLPGKLGRLVRRYGWLAGVYIAVTGLGAAAIGTLARVMVKKMFSGFGVPIVNVTPGGMMISHNPVYIMGTFILAAGIVLIIVGAALAVYLKKKFDQEDEK